MSKEKDRISQDLIENVNGMLSSDISTIDVYRNAVANQARMGMLAEDAIMRGEDREDLNEMMQQNAGIIHVLGNLLRGKKLN